MDHQNLLPKNSWLRYESKHVWAEQCSSNRSIGAVVMEENSVGSVGLFRYNTFSLFCSQSVLFWSVEAHLRRILTCSVFVCREQTRAARGGVVRIHPDMSSHDRCTWTGLAPGQARHLDRPGTWTGLAPGQARHQSMTLHHTHCQNCEVQTSHSSEEL